MVNGGRHRRVLDGHHAIGASILGPDPHYYYGRKAA